MADKEANLIIRLKDEASKGLASLKSSIAAVGVSVAGLTAFLASSLKSFLESESAVNKLNTALKSQGIFTEQLSKEMQNYAKELQKQTTFSDEAILSSQTLLTTFGLAGKTLKETTLQAANLASTFGVDLQTATFALGKAYAGNVSLLERMMGVQVAGATSAEQLANALQLVNDKTSGHAAAELETYAGQLKNLNERFDNLKENIGKALIPAMDFIVSRFQLFFDVIEESGGALNAFALAGLESLKSMVAGIQYAVEQFPYLTTALGMVGVNFESINQSIQNQIDKIIELGIQDQIHADQTLLNSNMTTQMQLTNAARLAADDAKKAAESTAREKKKQMDIKAARDAGYAAYLKNNEDMQKADDAFQQHKIQAVSTALGYISSLSTSKNKELAVLGKAAAVADASIRAYQAANLAMATIPPPYGQILAAAVYTAAMANVASIAGVQLAEGGVVMPRMGGVHATLAEAGQAEAVIPLGSDRSREKLQEAGLGNTTNINISVGTLVGGEDSVRLLAKMIDQELFSLRRNNESVAFEAI